MQIVAPAPLGRLIAIVLAFLFGLSDAPARPGPVNHARPGAVRSPARLRPPFAVGIRTITFVDTSRTVRVPGHKQPLPRRLVTVIRYPAEGPASGADRPGAAPARAAGPFPLVIFGHGFAVTPGPYARLLRAWAAAGYVVAAPIFPLGNEDAPGGPNEADLVNQPRDMSFVISRLLALAAGGHETLSRPSALAAGADGTFSRLIDPREIAVSGQSDGGETALATAYDRRFIDRRVRAAVILSGAEIPGVGAFAFPAPSPPLLATQGTADTVNPPALTYAFFNPAPRPKYLLTLPGASHLAPYTTQEPQLGIVERVTIDFLGHYLKRARGALSAMKRAGNVRGVATLQADP